MKYTTLNPISSRTWCSPVLPVNVTDSAPPSISKNLLWNCNYLDSTELHIVSPMKYQWINVSSVYTKKRRPIFYKKNSITRSRKISLQTYESPPQMNYNIMLVVASTLSVRQSPKTLYTEPKNLHDNMTLSHSGKHVCFIIFTKTCKHYFFTKNGALQWSLQ